jgi:tetratricopeptide (TPR) repeat protein
LSHLKETDAERWVAGELAPEDRRRIVRHFLSGCRWCRARLASQADALFHAEKLDAGTGGLASSGYEAALDRAADRARRYQSRHRKDRARLERALAADSNREGTGVAPEVLSLTGWPRVEALLRLSFEERYRDPQRMVLLALAACLAVKSLDLKEHGPGPIADLLARALAELANAYRVNEQFVFTESALIEAGDLLDEGTGDLSLLARITNVKASLCRDQRRLGEALDLLDITYDLYRRIGDLHLAGRALISRGITLHYDGDSREAVSSLRDGLRLIDSERDVHLAATGSQALLHALTDCGEFAEAGRLLLGSNLRQAFASEPLNLLKLRGVEGKVLAGLGKLARAERIFAEVREGFFLFRREYDAALVGLELAAVWLRQGKTAEVRELAEETLEVLRDLDVQQEAFKAALFLHEACRREAVTLGLLRNVHEFLVRLEWQPHLRFAP